MNINQNFDSNYLEQINKLQEEQKIMQNKINNLQKKNFKLSFQYFKLKQNLFVTNKFCSSHKILINIKNKDRLSTITE